MSKRLFIVSNRLPITVNADKEGIKVTPSSGGLVSAINSYLNNEHIADNEFTATFWVGMAGCGAGVWQKANETMWD